MKLRALAVLVFLAAIVHPAMAFISGSSVVSNCGGEAGNWIYITFESDEGVQLVDAWWDFEGSGVWWDRDGDSWCGADSSGIVSHTRYFDVGPGVDTQDWGATWVGFGSGDWYRDAMDLDLNGGGTPFTENYYGGTITVEFSDGSTAVGVFDTEYDWPNGARAYFQVTPAPLPNFSFNARSGWAAPFVPRPSDDAIPGDVPAPLLLPGDALSTWLNATCQNDGTVASGPPTLTIHCDDVLMQSIAYHVGIAPGAWFGPLNLGPYELKAGRHTVRVTADPADEIEESDEGDNVYATQYSWAPHTLVYGAPQTRSAPPDANADLGLLPGPAPQNCDGVRIVKDATPGQGDWMAVWSQRLAPSGDSYPLRLFDATNDPGTGFATPLATSQGGQGLEAFIVNTRHSSATLYDVGVFNPQADATAYEVGATYEGLTNLARGTYAPYGGERLRLVEFFSAIGNLGPATLTLQADPAQGALHFGWLPVDHAVGNLLDLRDVVTTDATGHAKILLDLALIGNCAAVFWQDGATAPLDATLGYVGPLPDLEPYQPAGWAGTVIPRPTADATVGSCDLPDILYGDVAATWMNAAIWNTGNALADTVGIGFVFDGYIDVWTRNLARVLDHGDPYIITNMERQGVPFTIPAGRHTVTAKADWGEYLGESLETNNWTGRQFCWTPPELAMGTPITRGSPPNRYDGHAECDPGQVLYPNCDGMRLPPPQSAWRGLAVMPQAMFVDIDVELHAPLVGATGGFGPRKLAESTYGAGLIDFVLVNDRSAPATAYDVGVLDDVDEFMAYYSAHPVEALVHQEKPIGQTVRYAMPADHLLDLHEYYFLAGPMLISLSNDGTPVDWGLSIYGDGQYFGKGDHLPDGYSSRFGLGVTEHLLIDIPVAGRYCIAVWKANQAQVALDGAYRLNFAPGVTGTGDAPPPVSATRLVSAQPNPFNPQTTIHYALVDEGFCRLAIYDLQGRLVRTLVQEVRRAGPNQATWDGRDAGGRSVASGVYVARLQAGAVSDRMKLTLVK